MVNAPALAAVTLDDKYTAEEGDLFVTGTQALVRLALEQRRSDARAGLNTAGYISGYRGSPLGGYDQALWKARRLLKDNHIHFQPAVNEELGATSIWGSQQLAYSPGAQYQGVFGYWYGKGPGVDRSGDVFKHANNAGTAPHGGVLALLGDDHAGKSSTVLHQSEYAMMSAHMPVIHPMNVQELLDLGLMGMALSRFAGVWVGFKCITETMDSSAVIATGPERIVPVLPDDVAMPPGGLNIRLPDDRIEQERRLLDHKIPAAIAFIRANDFNRVMLSGPQRRMGFVTVGKTYLDLKQALTSLGLTESRIREMGISVFHVSVPWPLEPERIGAFAEGLEEVIVIEEKGAVVETQLKSLLYHLPADRRPGRIIGKFDPTGGQLFPENYELFPVDIARALSARFNGFADMDDVKARFEHMITRDRMRGHKAAMARTPYFCSGCPHNTSTKVIEGSRGLAGIGCHYMVIDMDRRSDSFTQMGGEGAPWIGQAPFTDEKHVFTNLGDGTYFHSGALAIRAAVASGVNITYKILFNDAVAMTGGQPVDGQLTPLDVIRQVWAEGAKAVALVSDDVDKYAGLELPPFTRLAHRDDLDQVQRDMRDTLGTTVIVYDQTCAAEKRRRRKKKIMVDPPKRVFINERVCEGCGDCSVKSNCVSVTPAETEFGRKRQIDQSSCNKDFSCIKGFCPSFVTVHGAAPRKSRTAVAAETADLPMPELPSLNNPISLLVTGIGGTGVVTIGALLGMAARLEGKAATILDQTGLAQKGGAVMSHLRFAEHPSDLHAVRLSAGDADAVIGCDMMVTASGDALSRMDPAKTRVVVNTKQTITGAFTRNPDWHLPADRLLEDIEASARQVDQLPASDLATKLLGDSIAANPFLLGFAWQRGMIPLSDAAILQAIALNGVAVTSNQQAFYWGRRAAVDPDGVRAAAEPKTVVDPIAHAHRRRSETLDDMIARRMEELTAYQDSAYASRYKTVVDRVAKAEAAQVPGSDKLTRTVARYLFKLMAIKDEYEVARLYTDGTFEKQLTAAFDGNFTLEFHLAPPLLAPRDPETGVLQKRTYGPWIFTAFKLLARLKGVRGTWADIFGRTEERRMERRLITDYEALIDRLLPTLTAANLDLAVALAGLPEQIRGYGHVKERNVEATKAREAELLAMFQTDQAAPIAAE